jgi:hypothetical protein
MHILTFLWLNQRLSHVYVPFSSKFRSIVAYLYISNESIFVFYPCGDTLFVQWQRLQLIYKAAKAFKLKLGQMHLSVLSGATLGIPHLAIVGAPARVRG